MSARVALWQGALARQPGLVGELKSVAGARSVDDGEGESSEAMEPEAVVVDPSDTDRVDDHFDDESSDDDPFFADFDPEFENAEKPSSAGAGRTDSSAERDVDGKSIPVVEHNFEEQADLWLTRSHTGLEHALLSLGLTRHVLPTKRPVLVFGSRREGLREPEYHRVTVCAERWPPRLRSTSRLASTDAAEMLASSESERDTLTGPGFSGDTVAVEIPNPLVSVDRWIVIWPDLHELPTRASAESAERPSQWRHVHVRRVVWWVDREQIGPRDTRHWLSQYWSEVPVRVALFGATSFVRDDRDNPQSNVLPRVRRALDKFESLRPSPWVVAGP